MAENGADLDDLVAVLSAFGGFFAHRARQPAPFGLPTLRAFQRVQAGAIISWLRAANLIR